MASGSPGAVHYRNQQVNFVGLDTNGQTANQTRNIGATSIKGAEADLRFPVTPTTLLSANVQYLDTIAKSFVYPTANSVPPQLTGCPVSPGSSPALVNVDCSGLPAYNSPKWTVNLAAQQTIEFGDFNILVGADTQYKSSRFVAFGYLPEELLPGVWRSNARVTFGPRDDSWLLTGFVSNIENNRTPTFVTVSPVTNLLVATTAAPRTYGVRASVRF